MLFGLYGTVQSESSDNIEIFAAETEVRGLTTCPVLKTPVIDRIVSGLILNNEGEYQSFFGIKPLVEEDVLFLAAQSEENCLKFELKIVEKRRDGLYVSEMGIRQGVVSSSKPVRHKSCLDSSGEEEAFC